MEVRKWLEWKEWLILAGFLSCIIIAFSAYKSLTYKSKAVETISVIGNAEKEFESDLVKWQGSYSRMNMNIKDAYATLKNDEKSIRAYLQSKGIQDKEMVFSAVTIDKQYDRQYNQNGMQVSETFNGYNLHQSVTVESKNIDKVEKLSREVTELIESGIEFNSSTPSYFYTKLKDLKIDLLKSASEDAYLRAKTVADNSDASIGDLKKAAVGVFQITGQNSDEDYTYGGAFNTTDRNKKASITIRQEYSIR